MYNNVQYLQVIITYRYITSFARSILYHLRIGLWRGAGKKGHTPPGGRTKRDLFYLKGIGVYFMKRMVVQKLSRYNNSD